MFSVSETTKSTSPSGSTTGIYVEFLPYAIRWIITSN